LLACPVADRAATVIDHQHAKRTYAMASRPRTKIALDRPEPEEPAPEFLGQCKRPESGRYRLQVDRQTKGSYATYEDA
jgi:hypothetical protein